MKNTKFNNIWLSHRSSKLLHFIDKNSQIKLYLHNSTGARYNADLQTLNYKYTHYLIKVIPIPQRCFVYRHLEIKCDAVFSLVEIYLSCPYKHVYYRPMKKKVKGYR